MSGQARPGRPTHQRPAEGARQDPAEEDQRARERPRLGREAVALREQGHDPRPDREARAEAERGHRPVAPHQRAAQQLAQRGVAPRRRRAARRRQRGEPGRGGRERQLRDERRAPAERAVEARHQGDRQAGTRQRAPAHQPLGERAGAAEPGDHGDVGQAGADARQPPRRQDQPRLGRDRRHRRPGRHQRGAHQAHPARAEPVAEPAARHRDQRLGDQERRREEADHRQVDVELLGERQRRRAGAGEGPAQGDRHARARPPSPGRVGRRPSGSVRRRSPRACSRHVPQHRRSTQEVGRPASGAHRGTARRCG